jgi:hypothetical protein
VLKAYRDLEREGLVEPRAGHGTFVVGRPSGPPPGTHSRLARSLAQWVRLPGAVRGGIISSAAAPSLRRMSAASSAAAMISLVIRIWSATGSMGTDHRRIRPDQSAAGAQRKGCRQAVGSGSRSLSGQRPSIRPTSR